MTPRDRELARATFERWRALAAPPLLVLAALSAWHDADKAARTAIRAALASNDDATLWRNAGSTTAAAEIALDEYLAAKAAYEGAKHDDA